MSDGRGGGQGGGGGNFPSGKWFLVFVSVILF